MKEFHFYHYDFVSHEMRKAAHFVMRADSLVSKGG